jgi:hypothetical protein
LEILVPVVLTTAYIGSNLEHQQVNIFIFALVLAGLLLDDCGKPVRGGIALGAAVAMKVMPVLFLAYWVYRRRWRAMISGTLATLGFSLSPILVFGWRQFAQGVVLWIAVVRKGWGAGEMNLSLLAMLDRIIGHRYIPFVSPGIERLDFSGDPMVRIVWILLLATIALACLLTFRGRKEPGTWEIRAEWSVVFLVSALAGPVTWKHYLVVALLGNTLLWAACLSSRFSARERGCIVALLLLCFAMSLPVLPASADQALIHRIQMSSIVTDSALLLLAGLLSFRYRLSSSTHSQDGRREFT